MINFEKAGDIYVTYTGNPKYPLELFLRVITVSMKTMKITRGLPKLVLLEDVA